MLLAVEWGTGQVFLSMLYFFLFFIWLWLVIVILADVFRSTDLSGGAKAAWAALVIFLPVLGALAYVTARGSHLADHSMLTAYSNWRVGV